MPTLGVKIKSIFMNSYDIMYVETDVTSGNVNLRITRYN